ncbi:MAG: type II secretion system protein J [Phycisphaerae bacterium]
MQNATRLGTRVNEACGNTRARPVSRSATFCILHSSFCVQAPRRAVTLLEVVVALAIIVLMLGVMISFYWQVGEIRNQTARMADRTNLARQVLAKMESEIRGCVGFDKVGFPVEQRITGTRRSISFLTSALPEQKLFVFRDESEEPPPGAHDLRQIGYSLWIDQENETEEGEPIVGGIIRTEKKTLNQFIVEEDEPEQIRNDLWAAELGYLEFRYFDGVEWDTKWDVTDGNSLPQLIQITIGFSSITKAENEDQDLESYPVAEYPFGPDIYYKDRYTTIVKVLAADKLFGSRVSRVGKQATELMGVGGAP